MRNRHIDIVKYLYETCHAKIPDHALTYAAKNGHHDIVKYLSETLHANAEAKDISEHSTPKSQNKWSDSKFKIYNWQVVTTKSNNGKWKDRS